MPSNCSEPAASRAGSVERVSAPAWARRLRSPPPTTLLSCALRPHPTPHITNTPCTKPHTRLPLQLLPLLLLPCDDSTHPSNRRLQRRATAPAAPLPATCPPRTASWVILGWGCCAQCAPAQTPCVAVLCLRFAGCRCARLGCLPAAGLANSPPALQEQQSW